MAAHAVQPRDTYGKKRGPATHVRLTSPVTGSRTYEAAPPSQQKDGKPGKSVTSLHAARIRTNSPELTVMTSRHALLSQVTRHTPTPADSPAQLVPAAQQRPWQQTPPAQSLSEE